MFASDVGIRERERLGGISGRGVAAVLPVSDGGGRIPGDAEGGRGELRDVHQAVRLRPDLADGVSVPDDINSGICPVEADAGGRDEVVHDVVRVVVDERPVLELLDPEPRGGVLADGEIGAAGPADGDAVAIGHDPAGALLDRDETGGRILVHDAAHQGMVEAEDVRAGREAGGGLLVDFDAADRRPRHEGRAPVRNGELDAAVRHERALGTRFALKRARGRTRISRKIVCDYRIDVVRHPGQREEGQNRGGAEAEEETTVGFHLTSPPGVWSRDWNGRRRSGGRPGKPGSSGRSARRSRPDGGSGAASARRAGTRRRSGSARA